MKLAVLSVVLGVLSFMCVLAIGYLPYDPSLVALQDALSLPGVAFFGAFWPQGIHSDGGGYWAIIAVLVNIVAYSAFWFIAVSLIKRWPKRTRSIR